MKKESLNQQLKDLVPGEFFIVKGDAERQKVCRASKFLKDEGLLKHRIVTVSMGNKSFKVAAI